MMSLRQANTEFKMDLAERTSSHVWREPKEEAIEKHFGGIEKLDIMTLEDEWY